VEVEKWYTTLEIAEQMKFSENTIRKLFRDEPGVIALGGDGKYSGKRSYITRRIPESVKQRVFQRLTQKPVKIKLASRRPRTVVFLRDAARRQLTRSEIVKD
jgi:hypothetical protein